MGRTRIETRARARALQALYAWDMRGGTELERVASQVWDDLAITPEERRVAGPIVRRVAQRQRDLDAALAEVTTNWRLERIGAIFEVERLVEHGGNLVVHARPRRKRRGTQRNISG